MEDYSLRSNVSCLNLAINVAKKSDYRVRHGAVVFKSGNPISTGFNKMKESVYTQLKDCWSIHAESDAIAKLRHNDDCDCVKDILVVRLNRGGSLVYSRPCDDCMIMLKENNIRKVYYSDNDGLIRMEVL